MPRPPPLQSQPPPPPPPLIVLLILLLVVMVVGMVLDPSFSSCGLCECVFDRGLRLKCGEVATPG